jgi:hypothetical protein
MDHQWSRLVVPILLIGVAFVLALLDLFSSSTVAMISLCTAFAINSLWRRSVLRGLSSDYAARFDAANNPVRLARWSVLIFSLTYSVCILACGLGFFLGGSWLTCALLVLMVAMISKLPLCAVATDWELHRDKVVAKKQIESPNGGQDVNF